MAIEMSIARKVIGFDVNRFSASAPRIVDSTIRQHNSTTYVPFTKAEREASFRAGGSQWPYEIALTRAQYLRMQET